MMEASPELIAMRLLSRDRNLVDKYEKMLYPILLDNNIKIIKDSIINYYNNYKEHLFISREEILNYILIDYSSYKGINEVKTLIDTMYSLDISDSLSKDIFKSLVERDLSNKIINKLLPVITENKTNILQTIEEDLTAFTNLQSKDDKESPFVEDDIAEIVQDLVVNEDGLKWRLQCLQDSLGSLYGGILGHIFARPNCAKTSLLASLVTYFAYQLKQDETILWLNNEERGKKVKLRLYNAMLGASDDRIMRNVDQARDMFQMKNGNSIKLYDSGIIRFDEIRALIKEYNPRLVVIDQGDKIHFRGMSTMDLPVKLKELYKHYRELAKEFDVPIITVGQASSEAEGKKFLRADWMDYSKTGKYAEMDFILGIGKTHDEGEQNLRYLNVVKNKMTGREGGHTVIFDNLTAGFKDAV